jgi:hypothetical protein
MTFLPEEVMKDLENKEVVSLHNWLYSVVPASPTDWVRGAGDTAYVPNTALGIFLAGYCRNCNQVFSVEIPRDDYNGEVRVTHVDIPKTGCA